MSDSLRLVERVATLEANIPDIKEDIRKIEASISHYSAKFEGCNAQILETLNLLVADNRQRKNYEKWASAFLKGIGTLLVAVGSVLASNWWQGRGH
jgi:hypothetical protein